MGPPVRRAAVAWLAEHAPAVIVEVGATQGSVPRATGTRMLVSAAAVRGTVGGGHLELKAIARALDMLRAGVVEPQHEHVALGPALGQCCGGAVTLSFTPLDTAALAAWPDEAARFDLQLYGAGHVGRAIARALAPINANVMWIDSRPDEFDVDSERSGDDAPAHIRRIVVEADEPIEAEVANAPPGAFFLVLTHRHDLDLAITQAILRRGDFGFLGLIGSRTKRQRFVHQLERRGIAPALIDRVTCPIGIAGITGKEPEVIAAAVVAQLLLVASVPARHG